MMKTHRFFAAGLLSGLGLLCVGIASAQPAAQSGTRSLDEIRTLRKEAAHRARRIIFDNDGNEPVYYCDEATAENLLAKRTTALLGSQVDTIVYCTWSSGFSYFTHNTKAGVVFDSTAEEPGKGPGSGFSKNKTRTFIDQGTDPLEIMVDFCRGNGIEVFWSMRMNDVHDAWGGWYSPFLFPPIKQEHPDWLMGTKDKRPENGGWTAIDYGRPEVRDLAFRFFEEVCHNYDVDGVEMDFFRHLNYFRTPASGKPATREELDWMTDLLRRIRTMADQRGAERGRPILISARVPDSIEVCNALGFDLERWLKEDLIDLLVVSGYFRLNPWERSVELGHQYGVPVYPCLSESRIRDPEARKVRATNECYRARAATVWDAGADGVYLFNFFNPNSPLWRELGDVKTLAGLDKAYTTSARGLGNLDFWYSGGDRFLNLDLVNPERTRALVPGKVETVAVRVAEAPAEGVVPDVTLQLRIQDLPDPAELSVRFNETDLTLGASAGGFLDFAVDPGAVKRGVNRVHCLLQAESPAKPILQDLLLRVRYPKG